MKIKRIAEGVLVEAGLTRILSHITKPFTILTAFRNVYSLKENRARNRILETRLRELGAGAIKLIGHWQETPEGKEWSPDLDPEILTDSTEESYFVPIPGYIAEWFYYDDPDPAHESFMTWVAKILVEFSQDAAVYSDGQVVFLIDQSGELTSIGDKISVGKIQQAYSEVRGKADQDRMRMLASKGKTPPTPKIFVFEGTMGPSGIAHRMLLKHRGLDWVR